MKDKGAGWRKVIIALSRVVGCNSPLGDVPHVAIPLVPLYKTSVSGCGKSVLHNTIDSGFIVQNMLA